MLIRSSRRDKTCPECLTCCSQQCYTDYIL